MKIHLLPASFGDSILIEYGKKVKKYVLIDGGPYFNYDVLIASLKRVAPDLKTLELLVVTHVDIDHIDGIVVMLNQKELPFEIKEIWFNGYKELQSQDDLLGVLQGEYLSALINKKKIPHNTAFNGSAVYVKDFDNLPILKLKGGLKLTLLGPNADGLEAMRKVWDKEIDDIGDETSVLKRLNADHRYEDVADDLLGELTIEQMQNMVVKGDKSPANGCSIAFLAEYKKKSCLFTGDLFTEHILKSIEPLLAKRQLEKLKVDAWKMAHHGSKKSTLEALMKKVETSNILISSDGKRYHHPDKPTIAKLLKHKGPDLTIYFNYRTKYTSFWDNDDFKNRYHYSTVYPKVEGEVGISLDL